MGVTLFIFVINDLHIDVVIVVIISYFVIVVQHIVNYLVLKFQKNNLFLQRQILIFTLFTSAIQTQFCFI